VFAQVTEPDGNAVTESVVRAVDLPASGRAGRTVTISPPDSEQPWLAMAPSGRAEVVFQRDRPFHRLAIDRFAIPRDVMAVGAAPRRPFSAPVAISAPAAARSYSGLGPEVTIADSGAAVATWARPIAGGALAFEASVQPAGGSFAAPQVLDTMTPQEGDASVYQPVGAPPNGQLSPLTLAGNATGDTVIAWEGSEGLEASYRPAGGSFTSPTTLTANIAQDGNAFDYSAADAPNGTARTTWVVPDPSNPCLGGGLRYATFAANGAISPEVRLATPRLRLRNSELNATAFVPTTLAIGRRAFLTTWLEGFSVDDSGPDDSSCATVGLGGPWFSIGNPATGVPRGAAPSRPYPIRSDPSTGEPLAANPIVVSSPSGFALAFWPSHAYYATSAYLRVNTFIAR
jgi:hypothetical protein